MTPSRLRSISCGRVVLPLAAIFCALSLTAHSRANTLTVLHSFGAAQRPTDSLFNENELVRGGDGNFYGAQISAGASGTGELFKITPDGTFTVLHDFGALTNKDSSGAGTNDDGAYPINLTAAADGNFYGLTANGGARHGTFFRITPAGAFSVLYTFSPDDPVRNSHRLALGRDGNLYGTSSLSLDTSGLPVINGNGGAMYRFTPSGVFTVLHQFAGLPTYKYNNDGGANPNALVLGSDGNFYGTATNGGVNGTGTIFKATPAGEVTTLHDFNAFRSTISYGGPNSGGAEPVSRLAQAGDGSFYGTTLRGSSYDRGNIFRLTPEGGYSVLYVFGGQSNGTTYDDGFGGGILVLGRDGNFYGTSAFGSSQSGLIYKLTSDGQFTVLHSFPDYSGEVSAEGTAPEALVEGSNGLLYGLGHAGGPQGGGTIIRFDLHPDFFADEVALNDSVYYLAFRGTGNPFGYYAYLADPSYIYHFDLGYEYLFDAADGKGGVYLYDFKSGGFFYTSPSFPFPYLYDFSLNTTLYYYPDPNNPGRYNTNGVRYFYRFDTGQIFTK